MHPAVCPQRNWAKNLRLCLFLGELGRHLPQCGRGRGLPACQVSSSSVQPFGHNRLHQRHRETDRQTETDRHADGIDRTTVRQMSASDSVCLLTLRALQMLVSYYLWSPYVIGQTIYIFILSFVLLLLSSFFFSSPNLRRRRLDVCHILPHMVWP